MFRLVEASRILREIVPGELVPVFWLVTALGSPRFLLVGLSVAYWNDDRHRERILAVFSAGLVALSVTLALKYGLGLPRPPAAVQRYPIEPSPVGFPSGHAIAATTVYGGLVVAFQRLRTRRAVVGVAALICAIGVSRVVVGVHYFGDVLAGFVVGGLLLGVVGLALARGPTLVFGLAVPLSVTVVAVTTEPAAALVVGGSVGGFLGSFLFAPAGRVDSLPERGVLNLVGLGCLGGMAAATHLAETRLVAAAIVYLLLAFCLVALPSVVCRVNSLVPSSNARPES